MRVSLMPTRRTILQKSSKPGNKLPRRELIRSLNEEKQHKIALAPATLTEPAVVDFTPPIEKFKALTNKINGENLSAKYNPKAQMRLYRVLVPLISERVMAKLEREVTPLFLSVIAINPSRTTHLSTIAAMTSSCTYISAVSPNKLVCISN
jgi:hypothetical protein